jgi:hypothetical protein
MTSVLGYFRQIQWQTYYERMLEEVTLAHVKAISQHSHGGAEGIKSSGTAGTLAVTQN